MQAVLFIDGGALDDSLDAVPSFQQIEKTNPRLQIKLVAVYGWCGYRDSRDTGETHDLG